jgi:hypothetical protein
MMQPPGERREGWYTCEEVAERLYEGLAADAVLFDRLLTALLTNVEPISVCFKESHGKLLDLMVIKMELERLILTDPRAQAVGLSAPIGLRIKFTPPGN